MELMETVYLVNGMDSKDPPLYLKRREVAYLIEKGLVEITATEVRSAILIELGNFYND